MKYTKLEYIEGTGTQYIDLGFKLTNNHSVDLDLQMVKLNANIFGSRAGAMDRAFTLFSSSSVIMTDMGGTRNSTSPTTDRINVYLSSSKIKIGTFEKNISSGSFTTPGNGYIFNISYSRPQSYMASMKLYGCKIYLSGTLIRDLVPCKYNNQIGLWDTINGSFLGNAGTGEFVAGPEQGEVTIKYTELEYIESTGTQYINTREQIWNTSKYTNWKIDFDFTPTAAYNYNAIFGTASGATTFESWIDANKVFYFRYNNNKQTVYTITPNIRYNFIADYTPSTLTFTINDTIRSISQSTGNIASDLYVGHRDTNYGKFKIYSLKLYGNEVLVRDFIPCEYNGKIGLWDRISETFFANNGTGEFVAGPTIGPKTLKVKTVEKNNIYKRLQYIQSSGTQYINTGVKFTTGFSCDIKFNMLSTSGDIDILSSAQNDNYLLVSYLDGKPRIYLNGSALKNITMPYNTVHTVNMNYNGSTLTCTVDNTTTYTVSKSNATANSNLLLFARSSSYGFSKAVLYYCKIWNGDTLVKDLIPVEKASDNTICLYDLVSNTFLENSGTGEFIAGPYSLIGKTISKINGKYAKTINGVSIQCWKKKYE